MAEIKSYPNNVNEEIGAEHVMRWHHGRTRGVYGAAGELAVAALSTPAMGVTVSDGSGWLTDAAGNESLKGPAPLSDSSIFKVTARGVGRNPSTVVVLQSTYRR